MESLDRLMPHCSNYCYCLTMSRMPDFRTNNEINKKKEKHNNSISQLRDDIWLQGTQIFNQNFQKKALNIKKSVCALTSSESEVVLLSFDVPVFFRLILSGNALINAKKKEKQTLYTFLRKKHKLH